MTALQALQAAATTIARRDAETLLLHLLDRPRSWLLAHPEAHLPHGMPDAFNALVARRAAHEPLQYLTGTQEFYGLPVHVTPAVLIPRPETELLVEAVLRWAAQRPLQVADVGTGSGAIALALATHLPEGSHLAALDLSPEALAVAQANATRLHLQHCVSFLQSDLLDAVRDRHFDVVVSNPPYIPETDRATLEPQVREFEPHTALFAGADGLDIYRRLFPEAARVLRSGGLLALEFGCGQQPALATLLTGWHDVQFLPDLAGIPRIALAERPSGSFSS